MVIGETFAWGHMGKTGGDATWLFHCVSDLVEFAHPTEDPRKHEPFSDRSDLEASGCS